MSDNKALDLSDIGQHGHDHGTRNTPVIESAELKRAHSDAASRSAQYDADPQDVESAKGDLGRWTSTSDEIRHGDPDRAERNSATTATAQENSNIRGSK